MPYHYVTTREDYTRFASGGVFYHLSGQAVFPVRLMSEVFQQCQEIRLRDGATSLCVIYDPCCGAAYHLCTLAYLHWREIGTILCSDVDARIVAAAESNLSLLTPTGMERRCDELMDMHARFGKESHAQALAHARELRKELLELLPRHVITTRAFQANALQPAELRAHLNAQPIDIVFADVPYGRCSQWEGADVAFPIEGLLDSLRHVVTPRTVVAIASTKQEKVAQGSYTRIKRMQLGKRQITLLRCTQPVTDIIELGS